jgi:hypothetical protein
MSASILEHFAPLEDPRIDRNKLHELADIVLRRSAPSLRPRQWRRWLGGDRGLRLQKLDWLRQCVPFRTGVPSHDCIANVVFGLSPKGFQACLLSWARGGAAQGRRNHRR